MAGSEWIYGRLFFVNEDGIGWSKWLTKEKFLQGFHFSIPFLLYLTVHEFGHYFTALWYRVRVTLPYYIPLWFGIDMSIGTIGAFIRIKGNIHSRRQFFDIGIAGPLAGFVVCFATLLYGYLTLPPIEYIFQIHPEYAKFGRDYALYAYNQDGYTIAIGKSLLILFFENFVVSDKSLIPNQYEMMHYPYIFAGHLGLVFTALNLFPIGQLDGGHILYGLLGEKKHRILAPVFFSLFLFFAGIGIISPSYETIDLLIYTPLYIGGLYLMFIRITSQSQTAFLLSMSIFAGQYVFSFFFPTVQGYSSWLIFCFIIARFLGVYHPAAADDTPIDLKRKILAYLAFFILIISFSFKPIDIVELKKTTPLLPKSVAIQ